MKATMSCERWPNISTQSEGYDNEDSNAIRAYCEGEGILILEPTDPDEDRASQFDGSVFNERINLLSGTVASFLRDAHEPKIFSSISCPQTTTIVRSALSTNNQVVCSTSNSRDSTVEMNQPLAMDVLKELSSNLASVAFSVTKNNLVNTSSTLADILTSTTLQSSSLDPLVAAVLVNCATVNMISQLVNSIRGPIYNTIATTPNILSGLTNSPILTGLLSNVTTSVPPQTNVNINSSITVSANSISNNTLISDGTAYDDQSEIHCSKVLNSLYNQTNQFGETEHIRAHPNECPLACSQPSCDSIFMRNNDLLEQIKMHALPPLKSNKSSYDPPTSYRSVTGTNDQKLPSPNNTSNVHGCLKEMEFTNSNKDATEVERFYCSYPGCNRAYARRHRLNQHMALHTGKGPFYCDLPSCNVKYFSEEDFKRHRMTHSSVNRLDPTRRHVCPFENCDKAYSKLNKLKEHIRSHTGERPYVCRVPGCGAAFVRLYGVRRHELTHVLGKKRFRFPNHSVFSPTVGRIYSSEVETIGDTLPSITSQSTQNSSSLFLTNSMALQEKAVFHNNDLVSLEHQTPTLENKSETCPVRLLEHSSTIFPTPNSHLASSSSVRKPHSCPFKGCGKTFTKKDKLREHIWRHTGERPFVCSTCKASFVRMYDLRRHNKIHLRSHWQHDRSASINEESIELVSSTT